MADAPSGTDTDYELAFRFWRLLAESYTPLGNAKALVHTAAPFVLSNALWYPELEIIPEVESFYKAQGIRGSCALSVTLDEGLFQTLALTHAGFSRTAQFGFTPVLAVDPVLDPVLDPAEPSVEHVSWAQARTLGDVIAASYDLSPYAVAVGHALALALQLERNLEAFTAYDGGAPAGALITLETSEKLVAFVLEALSEGADSALRARLRFEAHTRGKAAFVFEQTEMGTLELWG